MKPKSREELETVIRRSAADQSWTVFSEDPRVIRKMVKLYGSGKQKSGVGFEWEVPSTAVGLRRPRVLTAEQKKALAEKLNRAAAPSRVGSPDRRIDSGGKA